MLSIERLVLMLGIMKTPEEILQMVELFIDDICIDSYNNLKLILNQITPKLRVFMLDIFKINNKLPQKSQEQLLDFIDVSPTKIQQSDNNLYIEIFKKLLEDKILICSNVVELTIFVNKCPSLLFELMYLVRGNSEIDDTHKRFIIGDQGKSFIDKQIEEHGEQQMAQKLSDIFWNVEWYEKCCKTLKIAENIYKPYIAEIKKDNLKLEIFDVICNLHDYKIDENRISKALINNELYNIGWTRTDDNHINIIIKKQTVFDCEKTTTFSRSLRITRGLKLTLEDVLDKTPNRTYHLK